MASISHVIDLLINSFGKVPGTSCSYSEGKWLSPRKFLGHMSKLLWRIFTIECFVGRFISAGELNLGAGKRQQRYKLF